MTFTTSERAALSDTLDAAGPDAPTLCERWDAHDLAAHLWVRENDPVAAAGLVVKPLSGVLQTRMAEIKKRWGYAELVERIRRGPGRLSFFALPGVERQVNFTEFFVHHEDVRRGGANPPGPRDLPADVEDRMWRHLRLLARATFRSTPGGVILERSDATMAGEPATIRAASGSPIVTLVGRPSELLLYAFGRRSVAEVQTVGEAEALDRFAHAELRH